MAKKDKPKASDKAKDSGGYKGLGGLPVPPKTPQKPKNKK